ncbi:efflux RND transporter permease subunit [Paraburkholderia sp. UYCP14C]|uniref:efflux RND transporter permease subunit n=1 Tax=Paraburkholderia sp. UYCP14C TaxID=2511130 RepID=UPI00101EF76A|nr:efflux RND transporter permease subunit [Paraburkholderia sp. UYCP14C]RZF24483.1 efflux RND transporter permease subunit [Paraburkholderia sp. UYCP14C]
MIGIVRIALKRPYTFVVLAVFILIVGVLSALRTPTDIFPRINIPVISVVWQYTGLSPDQMEGRVMAPYERVLTTTVNGVQHIEGTSLTGYGIVKIFFQPGTNIGTANAQVTAISQEILKQLPPSATPPFIINYNASTVPIIQLALSGKGLSEQNLADLGKNQLRPILATVNGAAIPFPFGGKDRQVQINIKPSELEARSLSAQDVLNALAAQNLVTPVGSEKIGNYEYTLQLNDAPPTIAAIANLPIKSANGTVVHMHDVADVTDGSPPQPNIVHVEGKRSVLLTVFKNGSASTLSIIGGIRQKVADAKASLPDALQIDAIGDQSIFVRSAIKGVAREGLIAALLTSVMILLFLGSWRSTIIIATSIPLAILGSIAALSVLGETLNIMTLGGLALAVGILVDDATVTIENINWHLEQGKAVESAILDGAAQIVTPAFVSLLCICIVFVPMFFLDGVAKFLFVPMAESVIFAMIASFILSRTLVPTMAKYLLTSHAHEEGQAESSSLWARFHRGFEQRFERVRSSYVAMLERVLERRRTFVVGFFAFVVVSFALMPLLGRDFFPDVDAGQVLLHVRAPVGTRVERTAEIFAEVEAQVRATIPPSELGTVVDNIGLSTSSINTAYNNTGTIGPQDGDIQISLKEGHRPTAAYVRKLRESLPRAFPGVTFSFPPADIVSQILNFGSPAPIDLQIRGNNLPGDFAYANSLLRQIRHVPGVVDARIEQSQANPQFNIDVDRDRASLQGLTERDVTNSLVVHMAGSSQINPTYWLNAANGVEYSIVLQTPQYSVDSLSSLVNLPMSGAAEANDGQILGGVASIHRTASNEVVSNYNVQPMVEVFATTQGRDLGAVAADIRHIVAANAKAAPKGAKVVLLGQAQTMNNAFGGLSFGILGAVVLIYLLIVVNFQSWSDPLVIVAALPGALAGIVWMLFATDTTLSVPALTGAIMCMGVATANSILVVSFCRERLAEHGDAFKAALEAGTTRFRPVLMTALSMIIGMAPMALSLGEGGEQNAPLGRAVIGGLLFATFATLLLVPAIFCMIHSRRGRTSTAAQISGDSIHVL